VTVAVVGGALVGVAQGSIGFAQLLESLFGLGPFGLTLMGVLVGVKLDRQPAISDLDLLFGTGPG
jgi:hypothetical protein